MPLGDYVGGGGLQSETNHQIATVDSEGLRRQKVRKNEKEKGMENRNKEEKTDNEGTLKKAVPI